VTIHLSWLGMAAGNSLPVRSASLKLTAKAIIKGAVALDLPIAGSQLYLINFIGCLLLPGRYWAIEGLTPFLAVRGLLRNPPGLIVQSGASCCQAVQ